MTGIAPDCMTVTAYCDDCARPYGDQHGFPDLIVPLEAWRKISPTRDEGGLLCPSCICKRLHDAEIRCPGAFMSGPVETVDYHTMHNLRWVENMRERLFDGGDPQGDSMAFPGRDRPDLKSLREMEFEINQCWAGNMEASACVERLLVVLGMTDTDDARKGKDR